VLGGSLVVGFNDIDGGELGMVVADGALEGMSDGEFEGM